jgi:hypothetical protein
VGCPEANADWGTDVGSKAGTETVIASTRLPQQKTDAAGSVPSLAMPPSVLQGNWSRIDATPPGPEVKGRLRWLSKEKLGVAFWPGQAYDRPSARKVTTAAAACGSICRVVACLLGVNVGRKNEGDFSRLA